MLKFYNFFKKCILIFIIYIILDIIFFSFLPNDIKTKLYNNRAHRIKSYYYHHDFRPNASFIDHWGYEKNQVNTNNLGFKDEKIRDIKFKNKNILFIGDSFTEGVGLKFEDSFTGIISKKITKTDINTEVLNAAVQSYSPSIYLSKIYHLIERKKFPITHIVLMMSGGDMSDDYYRYLDVDKKYIVNHIDTNNKYIINFNNFYKSNTLLYQFIARITPFKVIPDLIKSFFKKDNNKNQLDKKNQLLNMSNQEILNLEMLYRKDYSYLYNKDDFNKWGKKAISKSVGNLKRIIEITNKKNIKLTILYAEEPTLILKKPTQETLNYLLQEFKNLETANVEFHYINEYDSIFNDNFEAYKELFFIGDIHWNKKGNKVVADEILRKVNF